MEPQSRVAVLVNNLGGCSQLEMGVVLNDALKLLRQRYKLEIDRVYCGTFMTSALPARSWVDSKSSLSV